MPPKRTYNRKKRPNNNPNTNPSTNNTYNNPTNTFNNNPINTFNNNPTNTFNNNPINTSASKRKNEDENPGDLNHNNKKKMINSFNELQRDNNELTQLKKLNFILQQENISLLKYFDNAKNYIDYLNFFTSIINDFYEDSTNKQNFIQILETANTFLLEKLTDLQNEEKNLKIEIQNIQKNTQYLIVDQMIEYDNLINDLNEEKQNNKYLTEKNHNLKIFYCNIFKETIESKQELLKSICKNVCEDFDQDIKIIIKSVFQKLINIKELLNKNTDLKNQLIILKAKNFNNHTINDNNIENSSEYSIKISDNEAIQAKIYNFSLSNNVNFIDYINNVTNNFLNSLDFNQIEIQKNIEQSNNSELNKANYIFMQEINKKMDNIKNIKFYINTINNITILLTDFLLNTKHENLLIKLNDESNLIKNKKQELKNKHQDFVVSLIKLDQIQEENKTNTTYISDEKLREKNNALIEKIENLNCIIENFKISLESKKQLIKSIYLAVRNANIVSYNTKTKIDEIINELNNMKNLFTNIYKINNISIQYLIDSNTLNINQIHELNNNFLTI